MYQGFPLTQLQNMKIACRKFTPTPNDVPIKLGNVLTEPPVFFCILL